MYHAAAHDPPSPHASLSRLGSHVLFHADLWLFLLLACAAVVVLLQFNLFQQPIPSDTSYHIYAAQQILQGHPIYRDVAIIKAPLSEIVTTLALVPGRALDLSDTFAARLVFLLVSVLVVAVTYLAGKVLFSSRMIGVIAGLIVLGNNYFGPRTLTGPEPKSLMVLFALTALVLLAKRRWFWTGVCAALTALSWQPAAMLSVIVVGAAVYEGWRGEDAHERQARRWQPVVWTIAGISVPLLLLLTYLGLSGALVAAFNVSLAAPFAHLNNQTLQAPLTEVAEYNVGRIVTTVRTYCIAATENWQLVAGALGLLGILCVEGVRAWRSKTLPINLAHTPLLLYTVGFIGFTLVDFDSCPDLMPFLPVLGLSVGWLLAMLVRAPGALAGRGCLRRFAPRLTAVLVALVLVAVVGAGLPDVLSYKIVGIQYKDQMALVRRVSDYLTRKNQILSFGNALILVETHHQNASLIVHLGTKSGLNVLEQLPGGVDTMVADIAQKQPKLVTLSRAPEMDWNEAFFDWLDENYHELFNDKYNSMVVYIRNEKVPRTAPPPASLQPAAP